MINQVLEEIKIAEEKAETIKADALRESNQILLNAEIEAGRLKKEFAQLAKQNLKASIDACTKMADADAQSIIAKGQVDADHFKADKAENVALTSDKIVKEFLTKYNL